MHTQTGQAMLDVDTILGLPRPTKKPSSLRRPRPPAPPKHINKERALAIAKKFKISKIGKVSVRAGSSAAALDDPPRVSLQSEKVLTRLILLDREKGLETAMNTKDSAVGKCILGRNDYETRRLGVEFEKLSEGIDRKSYELLKRKSMFVHQRGLILTQGGIIFDPTSATNNRRDDAKKGSDANKPLPGIQIDQVGDEAPADGAPRPKRNKSPSYMRPLSCDRTKSTDSQVAEAERFLATPTMMRYANKANPDGDSDYESTVVPSKRTFQTDTVNTRRKSQLPEIAESISSEGPEDVFGASATADRRQKITNSANFPINAALNKSKTMDQPGAGIGSGAGRRHSSSGSRHASRARTADNQSKPDVSKTNEVVTEARPPTIKSCRRSHRKPTAFSTMGSQFKHSKKKHHKTRVSFTRQEPTQNQFNTSEPSKDPRFTELTSFLIPDSAKAFDLYRSMGRLSVLERLEQSDAGNSGVRTQKGKIESHKRENRKSFDTLY